MCVCVCVCVCVSMCDKRIFLDIAVGIFRVLKKQVGLGGIPEDLY